MFENIGHFFKRMVKTEQQKELGSKDAAKERLHLVLMQDRANVSADFLELMKQEIIDVIKKYIVVDEDSIDVRLTNQSNDDGTNGAPALYANIPIVNIKNDMMAEKIKSFEGVDFNKEMGILVEQEDKQEQTNSVENNPENTELNTPKVIELSSPVEDISKTEEQNTDIKEEKVLTEEEPEEVKEMFEEVYEDDEDDDVTFDDLLKAAEAADKELKEKQEQENEAKKESTSTEKPKTTKSGKSSTKNNKVKAKEKINRSLINGKKLLKNTEWTILIVSIILAVIGLVALYSATLSTDFVEFRKQVQWLIISIPFLILASIIDYNIIVKFSTLAYIIIIGLLIGVLFTTPISGASSWFKIGENFTFQPSEIGKVITILFLAFIINKMQLRGRNEINKIWKLVIVMILAAIPILLIIKEPDFGTALAYITAVLFMIFASGIDKKYIIAAVIIIAVAAPIVYANLPAHALKRIDNFLNPDNDPRGGNYNLNQSKLAIGSGEIFGMGLFKGNQTQLGFLYPKSTDFIFSVIGEEMGFVATGAITILYIVLVTKSVYVAKTAKDNIGSYIAIGIAGIFFFHMAENIGMTIGLLPITGVPLPFVSYGGSSLITNFICIGLLLNISSRRQKAIFVE